MILDTVFKKFTAIAAVCLIASPALAQQPAATPTQTAPTTVTATLSQDGQLTGNVLTSKANEVTQVPNAKVSLVSQGKVIDSVTADAAGNFSFANVHPGPYQLVGTAAGMVGSNALTVAPFVASQPVTPSQVMLQSSASEFAYDSFSSAPLTSFSTGGCNVCNSAGFGGGGSFGGGSIGGRIGGGRIGGRLLGGRGLLSPRGLLVAGGVAGGVIAISDSSPDR